MAGTILSHHSGTKGWVHTSYVSVTSSANLPAKCCNKGWEFCTKQEEKDVSRT